MKEGLIAFTLGELGILTAFVLIFSLAVEQHQRALTAAQADSLRDEVLQERLARHQLDASVAALRDSLRELRSPDRPSCSQTGLIDGYLFEARVLDQNQFLVKGDTLTLSGIRDRFSKQLAAARQAGCVHQAVALPSGTITAHTFVGGFNQLSRLFYVRAARSP